MRKNMLKEENVVIRHSAVERAEHWILAISGFILLFSGFGEFPMYKRYMVTQIPGLSWAGDFWINLKIHTIAAIVFTGVIVFHLVYHGIQGHRGLVPRKGDGKASLKTILSFVGLGEEPPADKYLSEQRLAYAYIGAVSLILAATGLIKVFKNFPFVYFPPALITWTTLIHTAATFFFLFGVIAHLAALAIKVNRPLIMPMFTGKIGLEYVRRRHGLWYEELMRGRVPDSEMKEAEEKSPDHEMADADTTLTQDSAPPSPDAPSASPAPIEKPEGNGVNSPS